MTVGSSASATGTAAPLTIEGLYRTYWSELVRFGTLMVGSRPVAEDVTQDAFIRLSRISTLPDNPRAYLRRAVMNGIIDYRRRRDTESRFVWDSDLTSHMPEIPEMIPHLQRLPERQRDALVLRFYLDITLKEIAEFMDCTLSTAKSYVHRGLATLKKVVEQ
jgi:RNA polymerase sigma factor (sigma-70 family)